ncbi:MAG: S1-like domain-containing RNA-binding protein [Clostridiales bacterium]|nr:S1-like domain-containing RNA-binding protein [Clostridiales bacterium]
MIRLGEIQTLQILKMVEFGAYLGDGMNQEERVLLPKKQVPEDAQTGDEVEVFIYRDSRDRLIATTKMPKLTLHGIGRVQVAQVGKIGAFLDWGLEKELLLPYREQTRRVSAGEECLVALYIDKSDRLCATMNVYPYLDTDSPYHKDDKVTGTVYEISRNFGAFVAVDDKYSGLVPARELYGDVKISDVITARVTGVKEDGKLDLSVREKAYLQMGQDAEKILSIIDSFDGAMPFNDKASPEVIRRETGMSKNEFKRAVGRLLKEGKITITEKAIRRID